MVKLLSAIHTEILDFISFSLLVVPKIALYWIAMIICTIYMLFIAVPLYWLCGADAFYEVNKILKKDD